MTKKELLELLADAMDVPLIKADLFLCAFAGIIKANITLAPRGVPLGDLGFLKPVYRKERGGINPQTRAPMTIPAKHAVKFVASKSFSEGIN